LGGRSGEEVRADAASNRELMLASGRLSLWRVENSLRAGDAHEDEAADDREAGMTKCVLGESVAVQVGTVESGARAGESAEGEDAKSLAAVGCWSCSLLVLLVVAVAVAVVVRAERVCDRVLLLERVEELTDEDMASMQAAVWAWLRGPLATMGVA